MPLRRTASSDDSLRRHRAYPLPCSAFIGASNQPGEFESRANAAWRGQPGLVGPGGVGTPLVAAAWLHLLSARAGRAELLRPGPAATLP